MAKSTAGVSVTPSKYMKATEVAYELGIARRTVDNLVASGKLPQPIRLTRKTVRWARADIEALAK